MLQLFFNNVIAKSVQKNTSCLFNIIMKRVQTCTSNLFNNIIVK